MHEMSLVEALVEQMRRHVPAGALVRRALVRAGPLHGIEPQAMQWAWRVAMDTVGWPGTQLQLMLLPWTLQCLDCRRQFTADELDHPCPCGHDLAAPMGGDELMLMSITVDLPDHDNVAEQDDPCSKPSESGREPAHADRRD